MPTDEIIHRERFLVKVDSRDFTQIGLLVHIRLAHKQNDWLLLGIAPHTIVTRRQSLRSRYIKFMVYITISVAVVQVSAVGIVGGILAG